jgi:site-specific DNA-methyltransferase (adenine-specific)
MTDEMKITAIAPTIICGNALEVLKTLPADSVSCVVTSPPYFHLRKYGCEFNWPDGWHGELGLEPTIAMFLDHLIAIFDEVKRVLRPDGTCWVNIADKYATGSGAGSRDGQKQGTNQGSCYYEESGNAPVVGLPAKSMCGIPERFMLRMMERHNKYVLRKDLTEKEKEYVLTEMFKRGIL